MNGNEDGAGEQLACDCYMLSRYFSSTLHDEEDSDGGNSNDDDDDDDLLRENILCVSSSSSLAPTLPSYFIASHDDNELTSCL